MLRSEEIDFREGLVYDPAVKGYDSNFWQGDTANLLADTIRGSIKIGDTALVGSASTFSQYLYGDFEFSMLIDSLSPDSNDSVKYFGLRNAGDSNNRGAIYFDLSYDTLAGDSSPDARSLSVVSYDEAGSRQRKFITWDTNWGGGGRTTRFRLSWEADGITALINDTVVATLGDRPDGKTATYQINTSIPQSIRLSNRSLDTTASAVTSLKLLTVRHTRKLI